MRLKRRRAHVLGMFVLTSMALAGLLVLLFYILDIRERTLSGEINEGMWGPFDLERNVLVFKSTIDQIRLGEQVSFAEYQLRRDVTFSRVVAVHHLAQDNPTFDQDQLDLVQQIDETIATLKAVPQDHVPDPATAQAMLPLINALLDDSHALLNLRRQVENHARYSASQSINRLTQILITNIILLICVGFGFYWLALREARATEQTHRQLQANAEQAEELARTKERTRLAREIHDGLGHHLALIHVKLGSAIAILDVYPAKAKMVLEQVEFLTGGALDDVRASVNALRSLPIDEQPSMVERFGQLVEECSGAGLLAYFHLSGTPRVLPEDVERALFRVAQEGITNVRKHACANQVNVILNYTLDHVTLSIEDDGRGAWIREDGQGVVAATGYGLLGMRERVSMLNGVLRFHSTVNKGFKVEVEVVV